MVDQAVDRLGRLGGACSNEVIQIMEEIGNLVGSDKDTLHHCCKVEIKWS